jgi:beta-glucosidase
MDMGFKGWVMSDWGATHSTVPAALNGLDQQMPDDGFFGKALQDAVAAGTVPQSRVDDMVLRMLTAMFALNLWETAADPKERNTSSYARSPEHDALALEIAQRSITLLKNEGGLLPVAPASLSTVAVFGDTDTVSGGGSGSVVRPYVVEPAEGISAYLNPAPPTGTCTQEAGVDYNDSGSNLGSVGAGTPAECCNACAAHRGCRAWTLYAGACYLKRSAAGRTLGAAGRTSGNCTPAWLLPSGSTGGSGGGGAVNVTYYGTQDPTAAAAAAAGADLVVMVVATDSSEGSDRKTLALPPWQDALTAALAAAAPGKTVVIARCPGACTMPWAAAVPAILFELLPGQESGNSIASTLFGSNNPSGRLPVTFPNADPGGGPFPTETWLSPVGGGRWTPPCGPARTAGVASQRQTTRRSSSWGTAG